MGFRVNDFRASLSGGGSRPNLYEVFFPQPAVNTSRGTGGSIGRKPSLMCKGAQLPESNLGVIELPYFGRTFKIAGDRTFPEWTTTFFNDEDFIVRDWLESWMNSINGHVSNQRDFSGNANSYQANLDVVQYGKGGERIKSYRMIHAFPTNVSPIELAWDSNDTIEEYTVTWQYSYWEARSTDSQTSIDDVPLVRG